MREIINIMKGLAVSAMMARLGIGRLVGCIVLLIVAVCACTGVAMIQLLSNP